MLKKNIDFLIRLLIGFYIFSIHHNINFIIQFSAMTLIMFSFADIDLNMLCYFLYPFLLPWQPIKLSLQLILFDWYSTDSTLQFFHETFISDYNKRRTRCLKIMFCCPIFISFALWLFLISMILPNSLSLFRIRSFILSSVSWSPIVFGDSNYSLGDF